MGGFKRQGGWKLWYSKHLGCLTPNSFSSQICPVLGTNLSPYSLNHYPGNEAKIQVRYTELIRLNSWLPV